ncbi:hypothetical protein ACW2QC_02690 [Virgibacillus sp. FSP13]
MKKSCTVFILIVFLLAGCGLPKETEVSKSIHKGMTYTTQSSWDKAWDEVKNLDDYLHLLNYRLDRKKYKKMDQQVEKIGKTLIVMDKKKSMKKWKKLKKTWEMLIHKNSE